MAKYVNTVTLGGKLVQEPEFKDTKVGKVGRLNVLFSEGKKNEAGEFESVGSFFNVTVFGDEAAKAQTLSNGDFVIVTGRLKQDRWQQTVNGEAVNRSSVGIVANSIAKVPEVATDVAVNTAAVTPAAATSQEADW